MSSRLAWPMRITLASVAGLASGCDDGADAEIRRLAVSGLENPAAAIVEYEHVGRDLICGTVNAQEIDGSYAGDDPFAIIVSDRQTVIVRMSDGEALRAELAEGIRELEAFLEDAERRIEATPNESERQIVVDSSKAQSDARIAELEELSAASMNALMAVSRCAGFDPYQTPDASSAE